MKRPDFAKCKRLSLEKRKELIARIISRPDLASHEIAREFGIAHQSVSHHRRRLGGTPYARNHKLKGVAVRAALEADPFRSNRDIATSVAVDPQTVAKARERLQLPDAQCACCRVRIKAAKAATAASVQSSVGNSSIVEADRGLRRAEE